MEEKNINEKVKKIYFTGIGGISMSALAKYLSDVGYEISGSDREENDEIKELKNRGITINLSHRGENVKNSQLLVYSSAISEDNEELAKAKETGIKIYKRSEMLGEILNHYKNSVSVAGSHGKTTATALIGNILIESGFDPTIFVGGNVIDYGNYLKGNSDYVVAEACEYQNNFQDIKTKIKVILNIDNDHLDSFGSMENLIKAFNDYGRDSIAIINNDDKNSRKINNATSVSFGINNLSDYMAKNIRKRKGGYSFLVTENNRVIGRINSNLSGYYNIYNVLSAVATGRNLKIPFVCIKRGVENFKGVKRRNEFIGEINKTKYYADYAHHPKEIKSVIKAYKDIYDKINVIFQPHLFSRTGILMKEFISTFNGIEDEVVIYKTYPAREKEIKAYNGKSLAREIKKSGKENVRYIGEKSQLKKYIIDEEKKGKIVVILGAGDIYNIVKEIIRQNNKKKNKFTK